MHATSEEPARYLSRQDVDVSSETRSLSSACAIEPKLEWPLFGSQWNQNSIYFCTMPVGFKQWIIAIKREEPGKHGNREPCWGVRVCWSHFNQSDYKLTNYYDGLAYIFDDGTSS